MHTLTTLGFAALLSAASSQAAELADKTYTELVTPTGRISLPANFHQHWTHLGSWSVNDPQGTAWDYFSHDHARFRAYCWNEDGMGGICDENHRLCFAIALWNGRYPILKERAFGLTGNHGEDVKEYYFYDDATPSHSYLKYQYKYPQGAGL